MDYLPPTATELPPVAHATLETPSPLTALGAKGLGEGNTMSAPAAIANAVADALGVERSRAAADARPVWDRCRGEALRFRYVRPASVAHAVRRARLVRG